MKEKKDCVDDVLYVIWVVIEEGIVFGGGVFLVCVISVLWQVKFDNEDEFIGVSIVSKVFEVLICMIVGNVGVEGSVVLQCVFDGEGVFGYNVCIGNYEDFKQAGVIDFVKVFCIVIENVVFIVGMVLMIECIINDVFEFKDKGVMVGVGMYDDMM